MFWWIHILEKVVFSFMTMMRTTCLFNIQLKIQWYLTSLYFTLCITFWRAYAPASAIGIHHNWVLNKFSLLLIQMEFKQTFKFSNMDSTKRVALCRGDVLLHKASHDAPGPSFPFFRKQFLFVSKRVLENKNILYKHLKLFLPVNSF